jgi:peptidoglycan/LPS O-acetylase OafA/YrhL
MKYAPQHFDFVDALRGYAIFAVLVVHTASAVPPTGGTFMRVLEQGARGVQLFFITSALTLLMSWHARKDGYVPFIIRRIFRIIPLVWLAIPCYLLFAGVGPGYFAPSRDWSVVDLIRQVFFVDSFSPSKGSIVPGAWTVNTEICFYIFFIPLVLLIKSLRIAILMWLISVSATVLLSGRFFNFLCQIFPDLPAPTIAVWSMLSFPLQLPFFLAGFITFYLLKNLQFLSQNKTALRFLFIAAVAMMIYFSFSPSLNLGFWSVPLGVLVFCIGRSTPKAIINRPIIFIGKISFSMYIWHFMIFNLIYLASDNGFDFIGLNLEPNYFRFSMLLTIVLVGTTLISYPTYIYVERPFIRLGHYWAERARSR